jgi:hypothetical protein
MAFLERYLNRITTLVLLPVCVLVLTPAARAQSAPKPPPTFRTLALGMSVDNIFYDQRGKAVSVTAGASGFSAPYIVPEDNRLVFYRLVPPVPPETTPRRVTLADVRVAEDGGPFLILMMINPAAPAEMHVLVVDDSWEKHPVQTMLLFNFSRRRTTVKLGEALRELNPVQSHLFPFGADRQVWLQAATWDEGKWEMRVSGPQLTLPKTRSTVVLIDQEPSDERPITHDLLVRNFIDPQPAPPAP